MDDKGDIGMIKCNYIEPFCVGDIEFLGAHCFKSKSKSLLLSKEGTSIILSNDIIDLICKQELSDNIGIKLYQRGFAKLFGKERFSDTKNNNNQPTFFMIDFTTKCNLNCIYCLRHFENEGKSIDEKSLYSICDYIIKYCKNHNIHNISFQPWGGEPLIEIDKIVKSKKRFENAGINVNYTIQTNGLLLTKDVYNKLEENNINFGISIDGTKQVHDSHRVNLKGEKTFDQLLKRMQDIKEINPEYEFYTLSVNSMYTLQNIEESIRYLVEDLKINHLKFNLVHPNGDNFDWNMLIKEEDMKVFAEKVFNSVIKENQKGYNVIEANIRTRIINILNQGEIDLCHSRGCSGGRKFVSFSQEGNIYPCELIGSEINCIGNIYDGEDLEELIEKACNSKPYFKPKEDKKCDSCPYFYFCRGGCTASAMSYNKKPGEIDDMTCRFNLEIYPLIIELILNDEQMVKKLIG